MGTGDWNDGMNKVGAHGKGESVWNGWFFVSVLNAFAELAERSSQADDVHWCRERAEQLRVALEANAWDGGRYRRAYFDDGTPLGSAQNDECQIDAIPQAWAVISRAANPARAQSAMDAVQKRLVRSGDKLIQLFDPPFDKGALQPGYIGWHGSRRPIGRVGRATIAEQHCAAKRRRENSRRPRAIGLTESN
jgi:cellobiose phosphorylase